MRIAEAIDRRLRRSILRCMSPQRANLMEPVGRHIAGVEAILRADWPVGEAIASLRGKPLKGAIYEQAVVKSVRDGRW